MSTIFRISSTLLSEIKHDLERPHTYAAERVGFLFCKAGKTHDGGIAILASSYESVADENYIDDPSVGALINAAALRRAMQVAYNDGREDISIFHVHSHGHHGLPSFSSIDLSENKKFVPDFFNICPCMPHGAIVLSADKAIGQYWLTPQEQPKWLDSISCVGQQLNIWRKE